MKILLLVLVIFSLNRVSAQEDSLTIKNSLLKDHHIFMTNIFNEQDLEYQNFPYREKVYFHESIYNDDSLKLFPEIIKQSFEFTKVDENYQHLDVRFEAPISKNRPTFVGDDAIIKVSLQDYYFIDGKGNEVGIDIKRSGGRMSFSPIYHDLSDTPIPEQQRPQINTRFSFNQEVQDISSLKGSTTVVFKIHNGYHRREVTSQNIADTIAIDDDKYVIVDIFDNKVVLEPLESSATIERSSLKLLNITSDGKNLLIPKDDDQFDLSDPFNYSQIHGQHFYWEITLSKKLYNFYRSDPTATLEEFKNTFTYEYLSTLPATGDRYFVFILKAPAEKVILYEKRLETLCKIDAKI